MSKGRVNTSDLAALLASQLSVGLRESEEFVKALIEVIEEQLLANDVLKIKDLGTFKLQWNAPRKSVDVNTGEEITIEGYYKISFTPDPDLKESVNAPYAHLKPVVVGGAEPEEMDEEDEEEVEEEIMKEMEDPQRLAEAMRSITEQAIEIKDILSEMNMISGRRERTTRPVMVDEEEDAGIQPLSRSASRKRIPAQPVTEDAEDFIDADYDPLTVEARSHRPGPSVPYGPPPETPKVAPVPVEQTPPSRRKSTSFSPTTRHENRSQEHSEEAALPNQGSVEVWPPAVPRNKTVALQDEEPRETTSERKALPKQRRPASSTYFADDEPKPTRTTRVATRKKGNSAWMLFIGLLLGGVITYMLSVRDMLPNISWPVGVSEEEIVSDYVAPLESDIPETIPDEIVYYDDLDPLPVVGEEDPVDSLQLLFDTPRVYSQFIATETVIEGSRMTRISERHYGAKEFWVYIYEANRNQLNHPDDISKGMVLKIPYVNPLLLDDKNPRVLQYVLLLHDNYIKK